MAAELNAATGNGSWFSGLLNIVERGAGIYSTVTGNNTDQNKPASTSSSSAAPAPAWQKYLPWAIGAAVVAVLVMAFRDK